MTDSPIVAGMVGLFWVVEECGSSALIAHAISSEHAAAYGDMLTVEAGHLEYWSQHARPGASALRKVGIPTAPVWSEYEEWPRGRVLYDRKARRFMIRADRQLHHPAFVRLIANRFGIGALNPLVLPDDHYRSLRRVPLPTSKAAITATRPAPQVTKSVAD
jgi:hypothetical protein